MLIAAHLLLAWACLRAYVYSPYIRGEFTGETWIAWHGTRGGWDYGLTISEGAGRLGVLAHIATDFDYGRLTGHRLEVALFGVDVTVRLMRFTARRATET